MNACPTDKGRNDSSHPFLSVRLLTVFAVLAIIATGLFVVIEDVDDSNADQWQFVINPNPTGSCGENLTWELNTTTGQLTITGSGAMSDFTSSSIRWGNYTVKTVSLPTGLTHIGDYAFFGCDELESVTIPNTVESIGSYAFYDCSSLSSISIPGSVTNIDDLAFCECESLISITISESVSYIGDHVFDGCLLLSSINVVESSPYYCSVDGVLFNKSMTTIVRYPMNKAGTTYTIPNTVTTVWDSAFQDCNSLENITLPDSVVGIGDYAFYVCDSLTEIDIPCNVESIGYSAFANCSSLRYVTIPGSVTFMQYDAFTGCTSLISITVSGSNDCFSSESGVLFDKDKATLIRYPAGKVDESFSIPITVTTIEAEAFDACRQITSLTIPDSVSVIGGNAFRGFTFYIDDVAVDPTPANLSGKTWTGSGNGKLYYNTIQTCEITFNPNGGICTVPSAEIIMGGTLDDFPDATLDGYLLVGWFTLADGGEQVTGETVFDSDTIVYAHWALGGECGNGLIWTLTGGLLTISYNGVGTGNMSTYSTNNAPWYSYRDSIENIAIENGVASICNYAFWCCNHVVSIGISSSVTSVGSYPFVGCDALVAILVDESNTKYLSENGILFNKSKTIILKYPSAKSGSSYSIPDGVITVGEYAFHDCVSLESVYFSDSVEEIGTYAFFGCSSLSEISLSNSLRIIGRECFRECTSLISLSIPHNVTTICGYAFQGCTALTEITIPSSVSRIEWGIFLWCPLLVSIDVEEDNEYYCSDNGVLFNKDKSLLVEFPMGKSGTYTVPDSVKRIETHGFQSCELLTSVVLPDNLEYIGGSAFSDCISLTSVNIGDSVTTIDAYAFYNCKALRVLTVGNSLSSLGVGIFSNLFYIDSVNVSLTVENLSGKTWTGVGDGKLYYYTSQNYDVTFNSNGGMCPVDVIQTDSEGLLDNLPEATKDGSVFLGWFTSSEGGEQITAETVFNSNTTVYAHWVVGEICGDGVVWNLSEGVLTISYIGFGTGAMDDYTYSSPPPWNNQKTTIKAVVIGDGVTTIGDYSFYEYTSLGSVIISDTVEKVGAESFSRCSSLRDVTIGNSVSVIEGSAFSYCDSLSEITIPNSVRYIRNWAFAHCPSLMTVFIPSSVINVSSWTFSYCTSLESIIVDDSNVSMCSENGILYNKEKTTLIQYPAGKTDQVYNVPNTVINICGGTFDGCTSLKHLILSKSMDCIAYEAIFRCESLVSVIIPNSVITISDGAFMDCYSLETVTIPDSVTTIGQWAFVSCSSLSMISFGTGLVAISINSFDYYFYDSDGSTILETNADNLRGKTFILMDGKMVLDAKIITVTSVDELAGTVSGGGGFDTGAVATVKATPSIGYRFAGWYLNGIYVSSDETYSFTVYDDAEYIAYFERIVVISILPVFAGTVDNGTSFSLLTLPDSVTCFTGPDEVWTLPVTWVESDYNPYSAGTQIISGIVTYSPFLADSDLKATATVVVRPADVVVTKEIVGIYTNSVTVAYGTSFYSISKTVFGACSDGTSISLGVMWSPSEYDPYKVGQQNVSGTASIPFGYALTDGLSADATIDIYVVAATITSFVIPDMGVLPLNISVSDIGLPSTIGANLSDGSIRYVPVIWNTDGLDLSVPGRIYVNGTVESLEGYYLSGCTESVRATFVLSSDMIGIADIVFLIDTTGSMYDEIANVRRNITAFATNLESTGISVRWALVEYRDITCDGYTSTKIIINGSENWYIDAESFAVEIGRLSVNGGGDRAETVIDALEKARTLDFRSNAGKFFIVVTDADFKVSNQYGVSSMDQEIGLLLGDGINVSVVADPNDFNVYRGLVGSTGGILVNIYGSFGIELMKIADMIGTTMLYGEVTGIEVTTMPNTVAYQVGQYFDGAGMVVTATYSSGLTGTISGYSVLPCTPLTMGLDHVTITYRGHSVDIAITVESNEVPVTGVTLDKESVETEPGTLITLTATVLPSNASMKQVYWTSSNPNVATVNGGKVIAKNSGTTTITVVTADGGFSAICTITVEISNVPADGINLSTGGVALLSGESCTIFATVYPADATDKSVVWESLDTSVATVEGGRITAVSPGSTLISVTDSAGHVQYCYVSVRVTATYVIDMPDGSVSVYCMQNLEPGRTAALITADVTGHDVGPWHSEDVLISEGSFIVPYEDFSIHAVATKKIMKVNLYNESSEKYSSFNVEYGDSIDAPEHNEKESDEMYIYTFGGWRYANGSKVVFPLTVESDVDIYEYYTEEYVMYTVSFYVRGDLYYSYEDSYGSIVMWPMAPSDIEPTLEYEYTFLGWNQGPDSHVISDLTIDAVLEETARVYEYRYLVGDVVVNTGSAEWGTMVNVYEHSFSEGTVFDRWGSAQVTVVDGVFVMPTCDVILYAVCHPLECTVTFIVDGSVYHSCNVPYGSTVPEIAASKAPTPQYVYTFAGWYDAYGYTVTNICSDTVLYACFNEEIHYHYVIFYDRDGNVVSSSLMGYGWEIYAPWISDVVDTGTHILTFTGWNGYSEGMTVTGRMTFNPIYSSAPIYMAVSYYVDGERVGTESHSVGETVTLRAIPSDAGKTFMPWQNETVSIVDGTFVMPRENVTFTTTSMTKTHTVRFYDGSMLLDTVAVDHGSAFPSTTAVPVKESTDEFLFWFAGWVNADGTSAEGTYVFSDIDVHSTFSKQTRVYNIVFHAGDGVFASYILPYGMSFVAPARVPESFGNAYIVNTFSQWNTSADGEGEAFSRSTVVGDADIYAIFTASTRCYDVIYLNGTEELYRDSVGYGSPVNLRSVPSIEGQTSFWTGDMTVTDGMFTMPASDVIFRLVSESMTYSVIFRDYDGSILYSNILTYGTIMPVLTPVRESTAAYDYTFAGWVGSGGSIVNVPSLVRSDLSVTASYTSATRQYYVLFCESDGVTVLSSYLADYGSPITLPANSPTRTSDTYVYTFNGWNGYTSGMTVSGRTVFTADYIRELILVPEETKFTVVDTEWAFIPFTNDDIQELKDAAQTDESTTLTVTMSGGSVTFDSQAILSFNGGNDLSIVKMEADELTSDVTAIVNDAPVFEIYFGDNRTFNEGTATITLPYNLKAGEDPSDIVVYYISDGKILEKFDCQYNNGYVTFVTNHFSTYAIVNEAAEQVSEQDSDDNKMLYYAIGTILFCLLLLLVLWWRF